MVMMATRFDRGAGKWVAAADTRRSLVGVETWMIPDWENMALYTAKEPAMEPVCDCAAFEPAWERPDLMATTGFFRVTSEATALKARPSSMPSMYMAIAFTSSRAPRYLRISWALSMVSLPVPA